MSICLWLTALALGLLFQGVSGSCPPLQIPSFGQVLYNSSDVTQSQPQAYSVNATVEYQCAVGYQLVFFDSNNALALEQNVATCTVNGSWTLFGVTCQLMTLTTNQPSDDLNLLVSARDALIIVGAVLGALVIILLLLVLCCCCLTIQLRSQIALKEHNEAHVRTNSQAGLVLPNPIIEIKEPEDDISGNPLYLTPTEMNKFDQQQQQRQRAKLTRL